MQRFGVRRDGGNTDCVTVFCTLFRSMLLRIIQHVALHHATHKKHILIAEGICYNKHLDGKRRCRKEVFIETDESGGSAGASASVCTWIILKYNFREELNMTYIQAVILGLAQGLSEFLPISSSGHLALLQYFFGINADNVLPFAVLLHFGTLVSVFIVYWKDIVDLIKELGAVIKDIFTGKGLRINANPTRRLGFMIIVATIPTAVIGLLFNDLFNAMYLSLVAIGIGLLITGTILVIAERMGTSNKTVKEMKFRHALFVGFMQGVAICPGVSRSGSTLFGGLISGLNREFAVKFAFLISIPSILGSVILEAPDAFREGLDISLVGPVIAGVVVAAISGLFAIKAMIKLVSNKNLIGFSIYTWALGIAVIVYALIFA